MGRRSAKDFVPEEAAAAVAARLGAVVLLAAAAAPSAAQLGGAADRAGASDLAPVYEVDAGWPGELPERWILGQVAGIAVDARDHVWLVHRPRSLTPDETAAAQDPPTADCCMPAPSVVEFDAQGRFVQAWGGAELDDGEWVDAEGDWPSQEHGIFVDAEDNVWLAGNGADDHVVLKFRPDGTHLMTIGRRGETNGSADTARLGQPADVAVDVEAREVYVADGYGNRRVIVFDMDTGEYLRHWGAYGEPPDDAPLPAYVPGEPPPRQFRGPVHAVRLADDGRVYVADRGANRIQVFRRDGRYSAEAIVAPWTLEAGAVWDLELASFEGTSWLFVADGHNKKVWVLDRDTLETRGSFGRGGRQAGQFEWVHNIAVDSRGNLYTAEVNTGKRVQKFRRVLDD